MRLHSKFQVTHKDAPLKASTKQPREYTSSVEEKKFMDER